jgi:hypothetical protein
MNKKNTNNAYDDVFNYIEKNNIIANQVKALAKKHSNTQSTKI